MNKNKDLLNRPSSIPAEYRDPLTGLFNLNGFFSSMEKNYARYVHIAVIHFDVDDFKSFNEQYGFMGGNQFLQAVAEELRIVFIDSILSRTGGDHFVLATMAEKVEDRIVEFQERMKTHMRNMQISVKAGIYLPAAYEKGNTALFMDRAKLACDSIKHTYDRSYIEYNKSMERTRQFRHAIINGFDNALKNGHIRPYYQPHVRLMTGKRCGFEALSRWIDPKEGMISPGVFIEVLEDAHLIHLLDIYIIEQVCSDMRFVIDNGLSVVPVSVNLSRLDFYLCNIFMEIETIRKKYDIPANYLHIEVTESALTEEGDFLMSEIPRFHAAGYEVWMDDFGSGYSSLNNLMRYPFDLLKIDMNFLREFETNTKSHIIIASIVRMAKKLGIHTLAEGVETQEQYDFLREIGCERIQGYYKGKPVPFDRDNLNNTTSNVVSFSEDIIEPVELNEYYNDVGRINVLSPEPLSERFLDEANHPVSILENTQGHSEVICLYSNEPYRRFLEYLGYDVDWDDPVMPFTVEQLMVNPVYGKLVARCSQSRREEVEHARLKGAAANVHLKIIGEHGDTTAYAITIDDLMDPSKYTDTYDLGVRNKIEEK